MTARTDNVRSIAAARAGRLVATDLDEGERAILAAGRLGSFRTCYGLRSLAADGTLAVNPDAARILQLEPGETVWSVAR